MNFQVHKPDLGQMEQYLKDQENKKGGGGNNDGPKITWWDFPAGLSVLRIMPPWDPTGRVALPVHTHRIEFQGSQMKYKKYNWTCVNATFGKQCKICDGLAEIQAQGVDTDNWGPWSKKYYFNALIIHDPIYHKQVTQEGKKPEDVPAVAPGTHVLVKAPKTVYDWIVAQITNPMVGDITDIQNGIDIYVTKEGSGLDTKYRPTLSPNGRQPVPQEYLDKIEGLYNPDEIFGEGFDDALVDELVSHLKKTAGVFSGGGIANTHAAMGGYTAPPTPPAAGFGSQNPPAPPSAPTPPAPPVPPSAPTPPPAPPAPQEHVDAQGNRYLLINNEWVLQPKEQVPPAPPAPPSAPPVPPAPPSAPVPPSAPTVPTAPPAGAPPSAPSDAGDTGKPKCFGQHNPADVNCVVCPFEMDCSQKSGN